MNKVGVELKRTTLANGETLGYRERAGGDKVLLLVHGNMTSSKHWDLLIDVIPSSYKILAVDLRGFSHSTYIRPVESIKDFSDDLKLFVDQLQLSKFSMIGWSTGGAVAMQFCADYPGLCEQLILLASVSTRGYPMFGSPDLTKRLQTQEEVRNDAKTMAVQQAYDTNNRDFLKSVWNTLIYTKKRPNDKKYEEYVDDMLTQRNLAEVYHTLNIFNISDQHNGLLQGRNQVKDIQIPVLILRGSDDLVISKQMADEIMEDFHGRAVFKELPDCGHSLLIDNLDLLCDEIVQFLDNKV
ncbi:alpha/beta hydrolase [Peribacillus asahii]|uniref:Alpha/beta hydrolase n=1 Tax=Peribacillus asahii TaxID=228899 RepID=A0A398B8L7_9BACI|nr:alpha/beta hydrolase [Peribacillus asahii]RID84053.1 alpha/beta hydrolase [Peribacillus asahii]